VKHDHLASQRPASILAVSVTLALIDLAPGRLGRPVAAGSWTGYFQRDASITNQVENVVIQAVTTAQQMILQVDGDGKVTGTVRPYEATSVDGHPAELGGGALLLARRRRRKRHSHYDDAR
jgi:hypothetical protein